MATPRRRRLPRGRFATGNAGWLPEIRPDWPDFLGMNRCRHRHLSETVAEFAAMRESAARAMIAGVEPGDAAEAALSRATASHERSVLPGFSIDGYLANVVLDVGFAP